MRLTNERDQDILKAGISDAAASLLEFMPTMGAGEAITFGEGVALPTRIKFDLLPANELPRSNTASFTKNWAKDLPDDSFLHEVVSRWRAQTYNPDSANYSIDQVPDGSVGAESPEVVAIPVPPQPAPQLVPRPQFAAQAEPAPRPSLRKEGYMNTLQQSFGQKATTAPAASAAPAAENNQPSLASLIKQFRT